MACAIEPVKSLLLPYVRFVGQPDKYFVRFRYASEGRSTAIQGENSTSANKTFPSIEVVNYMGPILLVISCVTHESKGESPRPHPHNLISSNNQNGVYKETFYSLPNVPLIIDKLCIQCVRKDDINESLKNRERLQRDPFGTGYSSEGITLSVVCLAFEVYISSPDSINEWTRLPPIVSNPIYDKKVDEDPHIFEISECKSPIEGGKKIMLFTSKIPKTKEFIIEFFAQSKSDHSIVWRDIGTFERKDIHRGTGIIFKTPPFPIKHLCITNVDVYIQLTRLSDSKTSSPIYFNYIEENNHNYTKSAEKFKSKICNLSEELNPYLEKELNNFNSNDSLMENLLKDDKNNVKLNCSNANDFNSLHTAANQFNVNSVKLTINNLPNITNNLSPKMQTESSSEMENIPNDICMTIL